MRSSTALALMLVLAGRTASASDIYVDQGAPPGGDGSAAAPHRTLTAGLAAARLAAAPVTVHVARGTYAGSFDPAAVAADPDLEAWPAVLNIPGLTLVGETRAGGSGVAPGTETALVVADPPPACAAPCSREILLVTRTTDGRSGDGTTIRGFSVGGAHADSIDGILLDRVSDVTVEGNRLSFTDVGVRTRESSATVAGNFGGNHTCCSVLGTGGSASHPARLVVKGNSFHGNHEFGMLFAGLGVLRPLGSGAYAVPVEPIAAADRFPDTLVAEIDGNDLRGNNSAALRVFVFARFPRPDQTEAHADFTVHDNLLMGGSLYGVIVDAGFLHRTDAGGNLLGPYRGTFHGTFSGNQYSGQGQAHALFTFGLLWDTVACAPAPDFQYMQSSTYTVDDLDGESTLDHDNPASDPTSGVPLANTLTVNGSPLAGVDVAGCH